MRSLWQKQLLAFLIVSLFEPKAEPMA